jgi:Leu/Phe-tRNA-protein transferase
MCNKSTQTLCNAYIHGSLLWRATMNSFRLTTVNNTMLICVHSFRLSATTYRLGRNNCVLVEPVLSM